MKKMASPERGATLKGARRLREYNKKAARTRRTVEHIQTAEQPQENQCYNHAPIEASELPSCT